MSLNHSVSTWIASLKEGDRRAAFELWHRYFHRLVELARQHLDRNTAAVADEEDIAASCFRRLCLGAERNQFEQITDRDDLWSLLSTMARRRAIDQYRRHSAQRRSATFVEFDISLIVSSEPTPEVLSIISEEHDRLLAILPDDSLRFVAQKKLEGLTNDEVASALRVTTRSVERKLARIRECWEKEVVA